MRLFLPRKCNSFGRKKENGTNHTTSEELNYHLIFVFLIIKKKEKMNIFLKTKK
jgi:hypothetical protein